jgi:hypothetical protein
LHLPSFCDRERVIKSIVPDSHGISGNYNGCRSLEVRNCEPYLSGTCADILADICASVGHQYVICTSLGALIALHGEQYFFLLLSASIADMILMGHLHITCPMNMHWGFTKQIVP